MATLSDPFLAKWDPQLLETKAFQGSKTRERFKTGPKTGPGGVDFWRSLRARTGPGPRQNRPAGGRKCAFWAAVGCQHDPERLFGTWEHQQCRYGPIWRTFFPTSKSAFFDPQNRPKTRFWRFPGFPGR